MNFSYKNKFFCLVAENAKNTITIAPTADIVLYNIFKKKLIDSSDKTNESSINVSLFNDIFYASTDVFLNITFACVLNA